MVEAVKVALVKDGEFFNWLEANVSALCALEPVVLEEAVERSAILHAKHIAQGGDPFENGSSRPLDFGHWSGHKLEQITDFALSHAEGVAVGAARPTSRAETKVGQSDPAVEYGIAVAHRTKGTLGITG